MEVNMNENLQGVLKLDQIYFDSFEYQKLYEGRPSDKKLNMELTVQSSIEENTMEIVLKAEIVGPRLFSVKANLVGHFSINTGNIEAWKDNAVAIMFPYLRSQITLLTAQPDIMPIVLPSINVKKLLEEQEREVKE